MFMTSPNQWDAVFGITSAARAVGWPSYRGGNENDFWTQGQAPSMRRSPTNAATQNGWMCSGWGNAEAPPGGGRRAGLAQWQSSLDSWLSSALLSSSHDDIGPFQSESESDDPCEFDSLLLSSDLFSLSSASSSSSSSSSFFKTNSKREYTDILQTIGFHFMLLSVCTGKERHDSHHRHRRHRWMSLPQRKPSPAHHHLHPPPRHPPPPLCPVEREGFSGLADRIFIRQEQEEWVSTYRFLGLCLRASWFCCSSSFLKRHTV